MGSNNTYFNNYSQRTCFNAKTNTFKEFVSSLKRILSAVSLTINTKIIKGSKIIELEIDNDREKQKHENVFEKSPHMESSQKPKQNCCDFDRMDKMSKKS